MHQFKNIQLNNLEMLYTSFTVCENKYLKTGKIVKQKILLCVTSCNTVFEFGIR